MLEREDFTKMKTVYYSETLDKTFESEEECLKAEKENDEKLALIKAEKEARKQEAEEVQKAFEEANEAYKAARQKLNEFVKKHGSYHYTIKDCFLPTTSSLFDWFFEDWPFKKI